MDHTFLNWIYWNPNPDIFTLPFLDKPVRWYGFLFVTGIMISYLIVKKLFARDLHKGGLVNEKECAKESLVLTDRLTWFVVIGLLIGARLGHVFFYDWARYQNHPLEILKVWEGGLASHGGAIGILLALYFFLKTTKKRYPTLTFLSMLDLLVIPSALVGSFIRLGNFFNQEILGTPSTLPWAVVFGHPADGSRPEPRHPVQLYEGIAYLLLFFLLICLWKYRSSWCKTGRIGGLFLVLAFSFRFLLEFFKAPMDAVVDQSFLQMGQLLSLPFIGAGLFLLVRPTKN